jgi:cytochrome c biogenesis protein CcmG, thiol:disulfide interchange protein DsbE
VIGRGAALGITVLLAVGACGDDDTGTVDLPDLTLPPLAAGGPSLELAALRGPAVVNLWATWCAPCRRELPAFQTVSAARPDVRFIGIDIGEDPAKARDFVAELGVSFDQFIDARGDLTDALGAAALPVTLVVGPDGTVATEHLGPMTVDDLDEAIDAIGETGT